MTVARYLRVSTDKQSTENQEPEIERMMLARESAPGRPFNPGAALTYRETGLAAKHRPEFDRMMEDARRGQFKRLYVWSLDRFGRSMFQTIRDIRLLVETYNVTVISVKESWLEGTADRMTRGLLLAVLGWAAEHERERLIERTRAGLDRARAKGVTLGRRRVEVTDAAIEYALKLRAKGDPWRAVARYCERMGLGTWNHATLAKACIERVPNLARGSRGAPARPRRRAR